MYSEEQEKRQAKQNDEIIKARSTMTTPAPEFYEPETQKLSLTEQKLNSLETTINYLNDGVSRLARQLDPVMSHPQDKPLSVEPSQPLTTEDSQLTGRLDDLNTLLVVQIGRLNDLADRLTV